MSGIHTYEPLWGAWKVEELIGAGSFGKVYKVSRQDFGARYFSAVKIITIPKNTSDVVQLITEGMREGSIRNYYQGLAQDILNEIVLMEKFKGTSNIVSFEDHRMIELTDGIGYIILIRMELLKSLTKLMMERALAQAEVIKMGIGICKALELCAAYNVIHRDVKPENIFVSQHGDYKLGDFGIARQIEKTMSGLSRKGTYTYMAPEVYKGEPYNASVDIYSLGIVLYSLLNQNRVPFLPGYPKVITAKDRDISLMRRVSGEKVPLLSNVSAELSDIVLKACAYDMKDRYTDPCVMRESLERVLDKSTSVKPADGRDAYIINTVQSLPKSIDKTETEYEYPETLTLLPSTVKEALPDNTLQEGSESVKKPAAPTPVMPLRFAGTVLLLILFVGVVSYILIRNGGEPSYTQAPPPQPTDASTPSPQPPAIVPPQRFPGPETWPENESITLELFGISNADVFDRPNPEPGNTVETVWGAAVLKYMNEYEPDIENNAIYWLKVRTHYGMEGYIKSSSLEANIHYTLGNTARRRIVFKSHGSGWVEDYYANNSMAHFEYNKDGFISWHRLEDAAGDIIEEIEYHTTLQFMPDASTTGRILY